MKKLRLITAICSFFLLLQVHTQAANNKNEWYLEKWKIVEEGKSIQNDKSIKQLGDIVRQISRNKSDLTPDAASLFNTARETLLSIRGHSEFYGKEIQKSMDAEMESLGDSRDRTWAFETLAQLPSAETVKVLGELLYDDRDPYKDVVYGDTGSPIPNSKQASMALTHLGIKKPAVKNDPLRTAGYEIADVETWKLWYEQVRDGTRTFSFEGDDTIYSLSGRVSVAKDGPMTSRPNRKAATSTIADDGSKPTGNNRTPLFVAIVILVGLIVLTVLLLRKRSSAIT